MFLRWLGGAAILGVLFLLASFFIPASSKQSLPDLELTALNGDTEQLETTDDAPTVIYLWSADCVPCADEFELLAGAARSARYGGFRYLFVNEGNGEDAVRRYLETSNLIDVAANVYLDPNNSVYDALGASGLPASYFFRSDGVSHGVQGLIGRLDRLEYTLELLLRDL